MRALIVLIAVFALAAQPAWGWQRVVCRDGSPCPDAAVASDPCCPPAPCESQPAASIAPCTLSAPAPRDTAPPSAPAGDDIHEPVFLAIASVPIDVPAYRSAFVDDDVLPASSLIARQIHAPPAPPRA
jgi:hypothetical protein